MPDLTVVEKGTARITGTLVDESGNALPAAQVQTLTCTLYDRESGGILGGRNAQNILNVNGGTLDSSGNFVLELKNLDHAILDAARQFELHVALVQWTYATGTKPGRQEFRIAVRNLRKVS
jgi:hypothetical protein